jgi:chitinase
MGKGILVFILLFGLIKPADGQGKKNFSVIAYYAGKNPAQADSFAVEKLTHIIFSFCHLKGARLNANTARDTAMIQKLVSLKKRNPALKVMLSLGGWGGCETCSDVFSTKENREIFARSVKELNEYFGTDGIDLDWEYPTVVGYPGHPYGPQDKENFTELVRELRQTLGKDKIISFAAGGFDTYIDQAVEWEKVMKEVDMVNMMTYDLVNGYSTVTGHHTPLYSTPMQKESVNNAVEKLLQLKVPKEKIVIGAAFYGRMWEGVPDTSSGLYQKGKFKRGMPFRKFASELSPSNGFAYHWDDTAKAPYLYNASQKLFVTYDDNRSMELKTTYAREKGLGGIMFWQLTEDLYEDGLLETIDTAAKAR